MSYTPGNIEFKSVVPFILKNCEILFLVLTTFLLLPEVSPKPSVHVDGYRELEEPFYPFQQYIQVRKTYSVEHVPMYEDDSPKNLETSASSNNDKESDDGHQEEYEDDHYHVPRLRESIDDYKKHEVYEEKGYGDGAYDHKSYGKESSYKGYNPPEDSNDYSPETSESQVRSSGRGGKGRLPRSSLHSSDGTSTKILEYAAANEYDGDAHTKGIYAARDNIYCPEVIDFDLSSKAMAMGKGGRGAKPRLRGLGSKITCLKNKYFGREPLPRAIFPEPEEARQMAIEVPTFDHFYKMIRQNANSMSSFQHM